MKIYFVASVSGKQEYGENYQRIFKALKNIGADVLSNHVLTTSVEQFKEISRKEEKSFYKQLNSWINEADVIVAEVSHQSTNVGHEVSLALFRNKPVILLHVENKTPLVFAGINSEKLQLIKYNFNNVEEELRLALDYAAESQDTRFNFFISPNHQNYLNWIAKNRKIPRSVFLRRLINADMENNKEYSG